jgi:hypothetical protein
MIEDSDKRRFYAVRHEDDVPQTARGFLIPYKKRPLSISKRISSYPLATFMPMLALVLLIGVSVFGVQSISAMNTAAVPTVSIVSPYTSEEKVLNYGVQVSFTQSNFFIDTLNAFVESEVTFIEADLVDMQLRYFEDGILVESMPILSKGKEGSWWQTPAGLYKVEFKKENHFSSFGQVYQPWSMAFQGNFFIHGWPTYPDGTPVPEGFSGGCIRIDTEDAERLFKQVKVDIPILVHEEDFESEAFAYESKIPELETPHYLIADVEGGTVLASTDIDVVAPIASVTKLMTALIAAEYINLDKSIYVNQPTFVQSLIPRLGNRSKVSMYSLLQLLLVESSNEASEVIASQIGRDRFIEHMNEKALSLGMRSTVFADPSGLSAENTSSLSDLLRLSQYIYTNRSFILELTANQNLPTAYVSGEFGELINFNEIEDLDNFIGGKVGETLAAGQTSVTLHRLNVKNAERILAIIILGSEDRAGDVTELLRYAEERFGG